MKAYTTQIAKLRRPITPAGLSAEALKDLQHKVKVAQNSELENKCKFLRERLEEESL